MNESNFKKVRRSSVSIETSRKLAAALTGKKRTPETIAKLKGATGRKTYPSKCNKCENRDATMCARFNMTCFKARIDTCFRMYQRKDHPDYVKGVIVE